jgi:D-glycero-D-manno-heptose 1,7-bisphosphate phosphatase
LQFEHYQLYSKPSRTPTPAIFLDRDGVLIEDKHYICNPDDVKLCHGAKKLLEQAKNNQWPVVVITNQSGIARGLFDWDDYESVTQRLLQLLGPENLISAIYANGNGPNAPFSSWRKPSPGMLLAAAKDLNIDLSRSILVGDRLTDLQAGASAGLPLLIHVLTGHGKEERAAVKSWGKQYQLLTNSPPFKLTLINSLEDFPFEELQ